MITGTTDPTAPVWVCSAATYGQVYTNVTSGAMFTCATGGWTNVAGVGGVTPAGTLDIQGSNSAGTALAVTGMKYSVDPTTPFTRSNVGFSRYAFNQNTVNNVVYGHNDGCWVNQTKGGGQSTTACRYNIFNTFGPGLTHGNTGRPDQGWTVNQMDRGSFLFAKSGISQGMNMSILSSKTGDTGGLYADMVAKGGLTAVSDEGNVTLAASLTTLQSNYTFRALVGAAADQPASVTPLSGQYINVPQSGSILAQYQNSSFVLNPAITGCYLKSIPDRTTVEVSGCTLTPAAHSCTVIDPINVPANEPAGTQVSFRCHPNGTPMVMTTRMLFGAAYNDPEPFYPVSIGDPDGDGNQLITAVVHNSHNVANWPVYDDVNYGNAWLDLTADDVQLIGGGTWKTSVGIVVAGALDSTHLDIRVYSSFYPGDAPGYQQIGILPWNHSVPVTDGGITLTRASNVVTACGLPLTYSGQLVLVDGTDNSFDGTFQFSNISNATNSACATYAQTGADGGTTGTVSIGGEVGGTAGLGYLRIVPAAYVQYTNGTATNVAGHQELNYGGAAIALLPNNLTNVTAYNGFVNPFHPSISSIASSMRHSSDAPEVRAYAIQVRNNIGTDLQLQNDSMFSAYYGGGGGGRRYAPLGINVVGAHSQLANYIMPIQGPLGFGVRNFYQKNQPCGNTAILLGCDNYDIFEGGTGHLSDWHMDKYDANTGIRCFMFRLNNTSFCMYPSYYGDANRANGIELNAAHILLTTTNTNAPVQGLGIDSNGVLTKTSIKTGTTGSIGGGSLAVGTCATGTATVTGAAVGAPVAVSASDGTLPDPLIVLRAAVTATNTVTVQICPLATVTPAAKTYNVRTW